MTSHPYVVLLAPQRHEPNLSEALRSRGVDGPLAVVTAGWEEREHEVDELREHVACEVRNLRIYERAEDVYQRDAELFTAMRERHDRMRKAQELYRMRLGHALDAARQILSHPETDAALIEPEREAAIEIVRQSDAQHLAHVKELIDSFRDEWKPAEREHVARHRDELRRELDGVGALCIAGGHVAILLNRMRMFDLLGLADGLPIFAWGAGAMVLGQRIVLFHDSPPQGRGNAEVLEAGLGVTSGVLPLPHANHRLALDDAMRVELFARRFAPDLCLELVTGSRLDLEGGRLVPGEGTRRLAVDGTVETFEPVGAA